MSTRMKRHRQPLEVMASMNVTNMLDTAFILLITFMLIAPELTHGIKLNLPTPKDPPHLPTPRDSTILISIAEKDPSEPEERIYLNGKRVALDEIRGRVQEEFQRDPDLHVVLEPDRAGSAGMFVAVLGEVKHAGVERVGIKAVPDKKTSRPSGL